MPELPEVETTRRGLEPSLVARRIESFIVRDARLRWPVPADLPVQLAGKIIERLRRRGKYLVMDLNAGALIVHLGMSGALRLLPAASPPGKHDHLDWKLEGERILRYTDPRRFGSVHYVTGDPLAHALLAALGPEPFAPEFSAEYLHRLSRKRDVSIKEFLMTGRIVAGVGNIYANEALFHAGIDPRIQAGKIGRERFRRLVESVRATLQAALNAGGSSLRDWSKADGTSGYFQQQYFVYGRCGEPCRRCGKRLREVRQGQRASFFCPTCQKR
jgi:formamidopyrimidine-DNA glycosylase